MILDFTKLLLVDYVDVSRIDGGSANVEAATEQCISSRSYRASQRSEIQRPRLDQYHRLGRTFL